VDDLVLEDAVRARMGLLFVGVKTWETFDVRVSDAYVDIISLFTLNLKGTTNDGHHSSGKTSRVSER